MEVIEENFKSNMFDKAYALFFPVKCRKGPALYLEND